MGLIKWSPCSDCELRHTIRDIPPYDSELVALHVRQASQRQGIGQQLIRDIARHLR
jgi:ribosomal protein S18 acetylase RimI-like enzyme